MTAAAPNVGSLVAMTEPRQRLYQVNRGSGYSNPDYRWRWGCNVCRFTCENSDKAVCQAEADAHNCGSGWCAIPMTPVRVALLGRPHLPEPTPEDRERWNRLRERNRRRTRKGAGA